MAEIPLAILISGGGTTAEALIKATQHGGILEGKIHVVDVISNNSKAGGLKKAKDLGIRTCVINPDDLPEGQTFGGKLLKRLKRFDAVGVAQLGWLPLTPEEVVRAYSEKGKFITNNHPGALDVTHKDARGRRLDFGGGAMKGARVVCAQIAYCWMTGENDFVEASIHHVSEVFDEGKMIRAVSMKIPPLLQRTSYQQLTDEPEMLEDVTKDVQKRLLVLEHLNTIHTFQDIAEGKFPVFERKGFLIPEENADILYQARKLAIRLFPDG